MVTKWGQKGGIYNKYCPVDEYGRLSAAGCVAIAVAQVMAYNFKTFHIGPKIIAGHPVDWPLIEMAAEYSSAKDLPAACQDEVGKFIRAIGDAIETSYGFNSGSTLQKVIKFWQKDRFYMNSFILEMPEDDAVQSLEFALQEVRPQIFISRRPVIIEGWDSSDSYGHAWVMDGWVRRELTAGGVKQMEVYVYCNFGWNGKDDCDGAGNPIMYEFGTFTTTFGDYSGYNAIIFYSL